MLRISLPLAVGWPVLASLLLIFDL